MLARTPECVSLGSIWHGRHLSNYFRRNVSDFILVSFSFFFLLSIFLKGWLLFRNFLITEGTSHIGNLQPTTPRVVPANYLGPSSIVSYPAEGAWEKVR